ncbi:class I SAM-dependent methyltransferase [Pedobacter aquatilis]|uniref:class I SAM-dependent DNA methyltransferase n=1 Tax=Pedobacter aquatilis TaxID=351343 RepID=UPI0025B62603|nr:class I SAM-dependent methyltransferase [Pedobacter aquatilis]MDN3586964.1 class I SAM-dependent methyltransferase [Pedobacter aquatilis]
MQGNRQNVFEVYNKIGNWFALNRPTDLIEKKYLDKVISFIPTNGTILDIGCGTGIPIFKYFLDSGFNITGVDASQKMLSIAKDNFPKGKFILADMRKLNLEHKFDAVIAWHSFFHLPAAAQPAVIEIFKNHLNAGGILLFTSGTENGETWGVNGGENLFHASLDATEYKNILEKHHFNVLEHHVSDIDCGGATVWLAQYSPQLF